MTYERMHGREEGIAERLKMWRRYLATDKRYPWLGSGICDDLVTAARMLGADVSEFSVAGDNEPTLPTIIPQESVALEFDL